MTYSILNNETQTEITIVDGNSNVCCIDIHSFDNEYNEAKTITHVLNKKQLHDFIGALLHVQAKMRK